MKKLAFFSLTIIILSLYTPITNVSAGSLSNSPLYLNKYRDLLTGVSSSKFSNDFNIIVQGNRSFLYLGRGVLYPTDLLPLKDYKDISSNNLIRHLKGNWRRTSLRLILEYKNLNERKRIIGIIPKLGGKIIYVYHAFPFVAIKIPLENFSKIDDHKIASKIMVDYKVSIHLNESVPIIKPPGKWFQLESSIGREVNGSNIVIGILDTGIYGRHPDFYFPNGTCKIIYNVSFVPDEDASDRFGHGTHVAGIAAGTGLASNGVFKGVAPGALLANIKVLADNGTGYVSWILEGIEYSINKSIDVINLSLGGGGNGVGDDPLSMALDIAAEKGVVSVVAAGNSGPYYYSLGIPAVSKSAITVGAIEKNLSIAVFSSRGPTGDLRIKPDVVAPGADIVAPLAEDSYLEKVFNARFPNDIIHGVNGSYIKLSGTSMAAPHVAGVIALILQIHKNYTPEMVKSAVMSTAIDMGLDSFTEGNGLVNAYYAVKTPILIINSSNSFGEEYKPMKSISYFLVNKDNISHSLKISSAMLNKLYSGRISNFSKFFKINGLPREIYSNRSVNFTISLLSTPPPGVYSSIVKLQVDNIYNLTFTFSLAVMIKIVTNITYYDKYIDGYFIMYDKKHPDDFIFPAGYEYSEGKKFKYNVWFYVEPGNYSLFVASSNSPNESSHFINGPMFLATRTFTLHSDVKEVYLSFKIEHSTHYKIPSRDTVNNMIIPYFRIISFKSISNSTLGIFTGGLWNITTGDIYFSLSSGDMVYMNFQFIKIPKFFKDNIVKGMEYSTDLYTASWEFNANPMGFKLPPLYRFNISSGSMVDNDVGRVGIAVFPPKFNLTYVGVVDFFQGGKYIVHTNIPHAKEYIGILTLGIKGLKYRSLAYLDPTTSQSTDIRILSPPYTPFTYVERGIKNGDYYLNISSALITTFSPLNVIGEGNSSMKLFVNGTLVHRDTESGDLDYHEKDYVKWMKGNYSIYSSYNLSYPLYRSVYSHVYFNTAKIDYIPPTPYQFKIPPILRENSSIQFIFFENLWLSNISLYYSWNDGESWVRGDYTVASQRKGFYNEYLINSSITNHGTFLSVKIFVCDESGNYVNITMYNVSSPKAENYSMVPTLYFYPRYISPKENASLYIRDAGENKVYGLPIYIDKYLYFNMPVNISEYTSLKNFTRYNSIGEHQLESLLNYNTLKNPVKLVSKLAVTYLYIPHIFIKGEEVNATEEGVITYRADVNKSLNVKIPIEWMHNNSPAANVYVVVNRSTYVTNKYGFIVFNISSNEAGFSSYKIEKIYYIDSLTNTTFDEAILKIRCLKIIWDYIKLSLASSIKSRYPVNNPVDLMVKAVYAYDDKPFNGELIVDGNKIIEGGNGIYNISFIQRFPGKYNYTITGVLDREYNLTTFTPLSFNIVFDDLSAEYKYIINPASIDITIKVYFLSDGSPVKDALVKVNGIKAKETSLGTYKVSTHLVSWTKTVNVNISCDDYKPLNIIFRVENILFIVYISILIISIIAVVYLKFRRK